jgi:hypothetical protein
MGETPKSDEVLHFEVAIGASVVIFGGEAAIAQTFAMHFAV